jgi:hypothetical protein
MKKFFFTLLFISLTISNSLARSNHAGFYGGIEVSYIDYNDRSNELSKFYKNSYGGTNSATNNNSLGSARLFYGYKFLQIFDFEIGYSESSKLGYQVIGRSKYDRNYEINGTVEYSGLDYSAIYRPFYNHELNNFFIRAGGNFYIEENNITQTITSKYGQKTISTEQSYDYGYGYILGAGYDFSFRENFDFRISYSYLFNTAGNGNEPFNHIYSIGFLNKF